MKIDTQIQSQYKIQNKLKEHNKDRINKRMEKHIKNIKKKQNKNTYIKYNRTRKLQQTYETRI